MNRNLSNCEKARKKGFRGFNGIRTHGLCVSTAVLYQPELWRPIHWRPANLLSSSTRERNETQNEMMWTAGIQMKWVCDHRSESQFKQLRKSPKKRISGLQRDSNPLFDTLKHALRDLGSFRFSVRYEKCFPFCSFTRKRYVSGSALSNSIHGRFISFRLVSRKKRGIGL